MIWQDYITIIIQIWFSITVIPILRTEQKPPLSTNIGTGLALIILSLVLFTLQVWVGAVLTLINGCVWVFIAYQKYKIDKKNGLPMFDKKEFWGTKK